VSDAGCDPKCTFDDLGNAIRKVRVDLGVPITVDSALRIRPRTPAGQKAEKGAYFAVATIRYSAVDPDGVDGVLIYVKPAFYDSGEEPVDVLNYALGHGEFPHESTGDQFFNESQFESYRALGLYAMEQVIAELSRHVPTPGAAPSPGARRDTVGVAAPDAVGSARGAGAAGGPGGPPDAGRRAPDAMGGAPEGP
jgi:hypothetical protein